MTDTLPPAAAAAEPTKLSDGEVKPPTQPASSGVRTTVSRFVSAVPKLERKHSSGDLHSRLKTRKVLGVGATDNGDVHRSKISQVLGHNEHLYVRYPRGLLGWYMFLTCGLGAQGGLMATSPSWAARLLLLPADPDADGLALVARGYGITLIGLSYLLYAVSNTSERGIMRSGLATLLLTDACALGTHLVSSFQTGYWYGWPLLHLALRGVSTGVSLIYFHLSSVYPGARKSTSPAVDPSDRKKSM